jgi:hypothetical protein
MAWMREGASESQGRSVSPGKLLRRDVASLTLAFLVAELAFGGNSRLTHRPIGPEYLAFVLALPLWLFAATVYGLYTPGVEQRHEFRRVFLLLTTGIWLLFLAVQIDDLAEPSVPKLALFWALAALFVCLNRRLARGLRGRVRG